MAEHPSASKRYENPAFALKFANMGITGGDTAFASTVLIEKIKTFPHENILEIGCGAGGQLKGIAPHVPGKVIGVDISHDQLNAAQLNLGSSSAILVEGSVTALPFSREEPIFDMVFGKKVVHEIEKDFQHILFKEAFAVLRPGGTFILWADTYSDTSCSEEFYNQLKSCSTIEEIMTNLKITSVEEFHRARVKIKDIAVSATYEAARRYFPSVQEVEEYFSRAGFQDIKKISNTLYGNSNFHYALNAISLTEDAIKPPGDPQYDAEAYKRYLQFEKFVEQNLFESDGSTLTKIGKELNARREVVNERNTITYDSQFNIFTASKL